MTNEMYTTGNMQVCFYDASSPEDKKLRERTKKVAEKVREFFSADKTKEILKRYGQEYSFQWEGIESAYVADEGTMSVVTFSFFVPTYWDISINWDDYRTEEKAANEAGDMCNDMSRELEKYIKAEIPDEDLSVFFDSYDDLKNVAPGGWLYPDEVREEEMLLM